MALLESRAAKHFFSDEQLNIDLKIRHTCLSISGQTFPWADKGPA